MEKIAMQRSRLCFGNRWLNMQAVHTNWWCLISIRISISTQPCIVSATVYSDFIWLLSAINCGLAPLTSSHSQSYFKTSPPFTMSTSHFFSADVSMADQPFSNPPFTTFNTLCWRIDCAMRALPERPSAKCCARWRLGIYYDLVSTFLYC